MAITVIPRHNSRSAQARSVFWLILLLSHLHSEARAENAPEPQVIDASLLTCGDFVQLTLPRALVAIGWLGGFYAGQTNDTKVDLGIFVDKAERVIAFCRENSSMRLMAVVEQEIRRNQQQ